MSSGLDSVFAALGVDPLAAGVQIVPARQVTPPQPFAPLLPFVPTRPLLVCSVDAALVKDVQAALLSIYPPTHQMNVMSKGAVTQCTPATLDQMSTDSDTCLYLPAIAILDAVGTFDALREVVARLRAPDGCPWDRQQTHESLKPFLLEETYEVLEALDSGDRAELREELGDLMMQVMIHSQVAKESGEFDVNDVLAGISSKLIRRHPHVFGNVQVNGAQDVLRNWQTIKQGEKKNNDGPPPSLLGSVPVHLPALAYAQAMQERAGRIGFLQPDAELGSRVGDLLAQVATATTQEEKLTVYGNLLFALVQIARWLGVEAEDALRLASRRVRQRFLAVEELCRQRGLDMHALDDEQRQLLWEEAAAQRK